MQKYCRGPRPPAPEGRTLKAGIVATPSRAVASGGARGSEETVALRLSADPVSEGEDPQALEMDYQIAAAASLLYQYGYDFDWEQVTPEQQDIYHTMIGRLLRSIEEVD